MSKYKGYIGRDENGENGQEVGLVADLQVVSLIVNKEAQHRVQIKDINIDGLQLVPFSTETLPEMTTIMSFPGAPGSLVAKQNLWMPRGDDENPARCFLAIKGGEPQGYFNIGTSKVEVSYGGNTFAADEFGAFKGSMIDGDFVQFVYASTCYYDLVHKANSSCFSSHIIHTTKNSEMSAALAAAGWVKPEAGDAFFEALTSIAPELDDGRGPRFRKNDDGDIEERCVFNAETGQSEYELIYLWVHETGSNLDGLEPVVEHVGAGAEDA